MTTYPTLDFRKLAAGHDGPPIPPSLIVYFTERWRWRLFEFILSRFEEEEANGLTQAKLARRIGKSKEVINRWLSAPSNLEADSVAALMLGICAEEPELGGRSLLSRRPANYDHLHDGVPESAATPPKPRNDMPQNALGSTQQIENSASALRDTSALRETAQ